MSYGPPPKTPYGDQDFIKEDWPTGGAPASGAPPLTQPLRPPASPYGGQYPPPPTPPRYSQAPGQPLQQAPYGQQPLAQSPQSGQQLDPKQLVAATYNLTPEDQIFMQSWRKDSFYQRVLPLTVLGTGGYFYYNYSRQLPQRVIPYFLITSSAYLLGKWSYKDELKRRVEASPSQTPFMMSLRTLVGAQSPMGGVGEFVSDMGGQDFMGGGGFGSANAPPPSMGPPLPPTTVNSAYTRPMGTQLSPYGQGMPDNSQAYQSGSDTLGGGLASPADGVPLSTTSYEELRARNRGLMQK